MNKSYQEVTRIVTVPPTKRWNRVLDHSTVIVNAAVMCMARENDARTHFFQQLLRRKI